MIVQISAIVFAILTFFVVLFQIALASGKPWGEYAMGGRFPGKFPPPMRFAALVQAALLVFVAIIVIARAGLVLPGWHSFSQTAMYCVVGLSAMSAIMNLATRSKKERKIWAPVSILMLICSIIVCFG